jgi:hypothetical protein
MEGGFAGAREEPSVPPTLKSISLQLRRCGSRKPRRRLISKTPLQQCHSTDLEANQTGGVEHNFTGWKRPPSGGASFPTTDY